MKFSVLLGLFFVLQGYCSQENEIIEAVRKDGLEFVRLSFKLKSINFESVDSLVQFGDPLLMQTIDEKKVDVRTDVSTMNEIVFDDSVWLTPVFYSGKQIGYVEVTRNEQGKMVTRAMGYAPLAENIERIPKSLKIKKIYRHMSERMFYLSEKSMGEKLISFESLASDWKNEEDLEREFLSIGDSFGHFKQVLGHNKRARSHD